MQSRGQQSTMTPIVALPCMLYIGKTGNHYSLDLKYFFCSYRFNLIGVGPGFEQVYMEDIYYQGNANSCNNKDVYIWLLVIIFFKNCFVVCTNKVRVYCSHLLLFVHFSLCTKVGNRGGSWALCEAQHCQG
jgi:hypothetical protein